MARPAEVSGGKSGQAREGGRRPQSPATVTIVGLSPGLGTDVRIAIAMIGGQAAHDPCALSGVAAMFVVLGFYRRKPGLSHEAFSSYWRDVHGPLIRNHPEVSRYIKRYVQHHLSPSDMGRTTPLEFDGFSETWYESRADREALQASAAFVEDIVPDEAVFLDLSRTRTAMFDNQVVQIGELFSVPAAQASV